LTKTAHFDKVGQMSNESDTKSSPVRRLVSLKQVPNSQSMTERILDIVSKQIERHQIKSNSGNLNSDDIKELQLLQKITTDISRETREVERHLNMPAEMEKLTTEELIAV
jgi:hypothetical protein